MMSFRKLRQYLRVRNRKVKKHMKSFIILLIVLIIVVLFVAFIVLPIAFKYSLGLQRLCMFTNVNLPTDESYFANYDEVGLRNFYVPVKDSLTNTSIFLGAWHLLPLDISNDTLFEENYNFDDAITYGNYSVILYFHGAGEARSYPNEMYKVLRQFFHVIAFDYRDYADSSRAELFEEAVINDCVQLYSWLQKSYSVDIYVWGHSLGSSLATRMVSTLKLENLIPRGLVLESPFTSMREELPVHPYGKLFSWLPWFKSSILDPLAANGFHFNTAKYIVNVNCPIMILHAEDDEIVPVFLGKKLFKTAVEHRKHNQGNVSLILFKSIFGYNHYYIYEAPDLPEHIGTFIDICDEYQNETIFLK